MTSLTANLGKSAMLPSARITQDLTIAILIETEPQLIEKNHSTSPQQTESRAKPHLDSSTQDLPLKSQSKKSSDRVEHFALQVSAVKTQPYIRPLNLFEAKKEIAEIVEMVGDTKVRSRLVLNRQNASLIEKKYIQSWTEKCEAIGRLNYPRGNIEGQVTTKVSIANDGKLVSANIIKSSGIASLDQAVIKTVQQASPFQPFNTDMRKNYDLIEFTRIWRFSRSRQIIY